MAIEVKMEEGLVVIMVDENHSGYAEKIGRFGYCLCEFDFESSRLDASELRQIADKLDELSEGEG